MYHGSRKKDIIYISIMKNVLSPTSPNENFPFPIIQAQWEKGVFPTEVLRKQYVPIKIVHCTFIRGGAFRRPPFPFPCMSTRTIIRVLRVALLSRLKPIERRKGGGGGGSPFSIHVYVFPRPKPIERRKRGERSLSKTPSSHSCLSTHHFDRHSLRCPR